MSAKIRVKAAYMDKSSSRFFDNLTPVSTWVEPDLTVAKLLPILTKRFWTVVASEVLDDDEGKNAKVRTASCPSKQRQHVLCLFAHLLCITSSILSFVIIFFLRFLKPSWARRSTA